tara:strand:+ start:179 stop:481 length:303 start_codon:yes stop_codon:yes gene_type:complete
MINKIKKNFFILISFFLLLFFLFNFFSGERGLFSYLKKKELLQNLQKEEIELTNKISDLEFKSLLLTEKLDLDYLEILLREKFMFIKKKETIYIIKSDEN